MPRVGDVFQLLSGTIAVPNTTIQSAPYNAQQNDWVTEANSPRPVSAGGTGETTAAEARESLGAIGVGDLSGADTKAAVVETDSVVIIDSEDDNTNKRWLVSDINAYMRTISPPTGLNRNRLVNGAMQISQEVATLTSVTANAAYPADQWRIYTANLTGIIQATRQKDEGDVAYRLMLEVTSNQPTVSTGYWNLIQIVEGTKIADFKWGFATALPVVLRVRVRANKAGTYGFFIRNDPATQTYTGTFTLSSEELNKVVEKVIPIPPPPIGATWATTTSAGLMIGFSMAAEPGNLASGSAWAASGSVFGVTGQLNFIGTTGNEISFSAVGLYLDPDATGVAPKWEMPDEAEELRACQRYWWKGSSSDSLGQRWSGAAGGTFCDAGAIPFPAQFRIAPTAAIITAPTYINCSAVAVITDINSAGLRVTSTAIGQYRAYNGVYSFNARL